MSSSNIQNNPASSEKKSSKSILGILKKIVFVLAAVVIVIYLLVWALSPILVKHFAGPALQNMQLRLDENSTVRFNPFSSTLSINDLTLYDVNDNAVLHLQQSEMSIHLHRLLVSELYVSTFTVTNVDIVVEKTSSALFVAGVDLLAEPTDAKQSELEQSMQEEATAEQSKATTNIVVRLPELLIENIQVNASIDGIAQHFALDKLSISEATLSQSYQQAAMHVLARINNSPLSLDLALELNEMQGTIQTDIQLQEFQLASVSEFAKAQVAKLKGALSIALAPTIDISKDSITISTDTLNIILNELDVNMSPFLVSGDSHQFTLSDVKANASLDGQLHHASLSLHSVLQGGNVSLSELSNSAANWQKIDVQTYVELNSENSDSKELGPQIVPHITIKQATVSDLALSHNRALEPSSPLLFLEELSVQAVDFTMQALSIEGISIAGLVAKLHVNEDKSIRGLVDTSSLQNASSSSEQLASAQSDIKGAVPNENSMPVEEPEQPAMRISLQEFTLSDAGKISLTDASVKPTFKQTLSVETLKAGPFDSSQVNQASAFELVVIDDNYLKLDLKGNAKPFAEKLSASMQAKISELNLPSVSPYVKDGLGFEMKSGQLDVNIDLDIVENEIAGKTKLFLRGIEMSSADEYEKGVLKESKAMPLNAALGILKDDKGNIDLEVPMRGDTSAPSFGIESFVGLILRKAAMSQAQSYLLNTFVPYASVVSVAMSGAEYLLKVSFEPLTFNIADAELKAENAQFLSELALLMNDTPDLQIKTCAMVTLSDLGLESKTALDEQQKAQFLQIGNTRQSNLKRFLVEQGISSNRILYCAPELDSAKNAVPRIVLKTD